MPHSNLLQVVQEVNKGGGDTRKTSEFWQSTNRDSQTLVFLRECPSSQALCCWFFGHFPSTTDEISSWKQAFCMFEEAMFYSFNSKSSEVVQHFVLQDEV